MSEKLHQLILQIKDCRVCETELPCGPHPVFTLGQSSKILIVGQAPGKKVHLSGIPWDDQSGKELRNWLGVSPADFYDTQKFSILPMGLCYPGKGKNGDLPPRKECARLWHTPILENLHHIKLTLLIGTYAQRYYLKNEKYTNLTETVKNYDHYLPQFFPLPHPSPRNFMWRTRNPWFKEEVLPILQQLVKQILGQDDTISNIKGLKQL